jgi:hypothetical protein
MAELKSFTYSLGIDTPAEYDVSCLVAYADKDGDGYVSDDEFDALMVLFDENENGYLN